MIRPSKWLQVSVLCIMLGIAAIVLGRLGLLRGPVAWAVYLMCPLTHIVILVMAKDGLTGQHDTLRRQGPPKAASTSAMSRNLDGDGNQGR